MKKPSFHRQLIVPFVCLLGFTVPELPAKPRPQETTRSIPYQIPYSIGRTVTTEIEIPPFENSGGTLYGISYAFDGIDSFEGSSTHGETPDGVPVGSGTTTMTLDLTPQHGELLTIEDSWDVLCENPFGGICAAATQIEQYAEPLSLGPFQWNPAVKGKLARAGGSLKITVRSTSNPSSYLTGNGFFSGSLTITYTVDAKSSLEYAQEILADPYIKGITDPVERSREFYRRAINLRENLGSSSYPGASVNENLRAVEYFGRGYSGGLILRHRLVEGKDVADWTDSINEIPNLTAPISEAVYNKLKSMGIIGAENENAISSSGRTVDATDGWLKALDSMTLEEALKAYFGSPVIIPPARAVPAVFPASLTGEPECEDETSAAGAPLALPIDNTSVVPLNLFVLKSNACDFIEFQPSADAEYFVVLRYRAATGLTLTATTGVGGNYKVLLPGSVITAALGEAVPLPGPMGGIQSFSIRELPLSQGGIQLKFTFTPGGATGLAGISSMESQSLQTYYGNVNASHIKLKLHRGETNFTLVASGPSILHPYLQRSEDLVIWSAVSAPFPFDGDARLILSPSPDIPYEFFRLVDQPPQLPQITAPPVGVNATIGSDVEFRVAVSGTDPITFRWSKDGVPLTDAGNVSGATSPLLKIAKVSLDDAGLYTVRVANPDGAVTSSVAELKIADSPSTPPGMVLIPAGPFAMGDTFGEGRANEKPVHTVQISAFYMDTNEVTTALWNEVKEWALANGYSFRSFEVGKNPDHPISAVTWQDAVKWCNARSEKLGLVPAYYTGPGHVSVYRDGFLDVAESWVKWDAGFRLPTEAEWEKAARGGVEGVKYPWGNTISHTNANYANHPSYATNPRPYTSPVGAFSANGFGLYDMTGNLWEWCWDRVDHAYYMNSSIADPKGGPTGGTRIARGGSWADDAWDARVAVRGFAGLQPDYFDSRFGFRCVISVHRP